MSSVNQPHLWRSQNPLVSRTIPPYLSCCLPYSHLENDYSNIPNVHVHIAEHEAAVSMFLMPGRKICVIFCDTPPFNECTPGTIYHGLAGSSQYGKNNLFSSAHHFSYPQQGTTPTCYRDDDIDEKKQTNFTLHVCMFVHTPFNILSSILGDFKGLSPSICLSAATPRGRPNINNMEGKRDRPKRERERKGKAIFVCVNKIIIFYEWWGYVFS